MIQYKPNKWHLSTAQYKSVVSNRKTSLLLSLHCQLIIGLLFDLFLLKLSLLITITINYWFYVSLLCKAFAVWSLFVLKQFELHVLHEIKFINNIIVGPNTVFIGVSGQVLAECPSPDCHRSPLEIGRIRTLADTVGMAFSIDFPLETGLKCLRFQ